MSTYQIITSKTPATNMYLVKMRSQHFVPARKEDK